MMGLFGHRVFAYAAPVDLRKSFDTLEALVEHELGEDPLSGDAYLFVNKRCSRAKVLHFEGSGPLCQRSCRLSLTQTRGGQGGKMNAKLANEVVAKAISELKKAGVTGPTRIPWGGPL